MAISESTLDGFELSTMIIARLEQSFVLYTEALCTDTAAESSRLAG
jgi:hypothetical protein